MLQKFILNNMAKELTKHERDILNEIIHTMIGNAHKFLGVDEYKEYVFWQKHRTDVDALSPLTVRVFYWIAEQLGGNTLQVFQLWKDDQLIFYPDLPERLSEWSLGALENLEKKASRKVEKGEPIYLVYDCGFAKLGLTSIRATKTRGKIPFNLADRDLPIQFFKARHNKKECKRLNDIRKENGFDPVPSKSNYDEYSPYRNTKKLIKYLKPGITSKEYKQQYEESWDVKFNKTAHQQFRVFKKGLRKISQVKFANPELIYLTVQARTKLNYPYNIYALCEDDTLGKYYLEKVMSIVSLHYEDWEV